MRRWVYHVTALEDSGLQVLTAWMTHISAGPPDETGQALAFTLTTDHDAWFSALPAITLNGTSDPRGLARIVGEETSAKIRVLRTYPAIFTLSPTWHPSAPPAGSSTT